MEGGPTRPAAEVLVGQWTSRTGLANPVPHDTINLTWLVSSAMASPLRPQCAADAPVVPPCQMPAAQREDMALIVVGVGRQCAPPDGRRWVKLDGTRVRDDRKTATMQQDRTGHENPGN